MNGINFQNHHVINGMILEIYLDSKKLPTVGCGHLIVPEDHLTVGDKISMKQALDFFRKDLSTAEYSINKKVKIPLFQHEYDACISLAFNCGHGNASMELAAFLNTGNYDGMEDFIINFRSDSKHYTRRVSEARIFSSGVYDARH